MKAAWEKVETWMQRPAVRWGGMAALGAAGVGLVLYATTWGPGIGGDATIYITSARNLLAGVGLGLVGPQDEFRLLPYFPPFFSLVLSFLGLFTANLEAAARWLNALLMGGLVVLAGLMTVRATRSTLYAWLAAGLTLASPVLMPAAVWAMSEPLALFLGFASLGLLLRLWSAGEPSWKALIIAGVLAGLAFLTRYNAVAFAAAGGLGLLIFGRPSWKARLRDAAVYGGLALLPMMIWIAYDLSQTATVASRSLLGAGGLGQRFMEFWPDFSAALLFWLVPDAWVYQSPYPGVLNKILPWAAAAALIGWSLWVGLRLRTRRGAEWEDARRLLALLGIFCGLFLAVTLGVKLTTYPPITINARMLSPLHLAVLVAAVGLAWVSGRFAARTAWVQVGLAAALILAGLWYARLSLPVAKQYARLGLGYNSAEWRGSELIQAVRALPEDTLIITNQETALLALTGRASYPLKEVYLNQGLSEFSRYGDGDLSQDPAQRLFREDGAALVLFDQIDDQLAELYGERTEERIRTLVTGLYRALRVEDGGIFYYSEPPQP